MQPQVLFEKLAVCSNYCGEDIIRWKHIGETPYTEQRANLRYSNNAKVVIESEVIIFTSRYISTLTQVHHTSPLPTERRLHAYNVQPLAPVAQPISLFATSEQ